MFSFKTSILANRVAWTALLMMCLSACDNDNVGTITTTSAEGSHVEMVPPQRIAQSRAIEPGKLDLVVTVNADRVPMGLPNADGVRSGTINLTEGSQHFVRVIWTENSNEEPLVLAVNEDTILVNGGANAQQDIVFRNDEYNYNFDDDRDDRSNFDELEANTNPLDATSPGFAPNRVDVTVRIQIPDERILSNNMLLGTITPVAIVNNEVEVPLVREGNNTWIGEANVVQNSSAFAEVTFFQAPDRMLALSTARFSDVVGEGNDINIPSSQFDSAPFDQDTDGLSNLDELLGGSDPFDSSSGPEPVDPCESGNFTQGCTIDSDNDNKPDSQEGETLDTDGDGQPNYLESALQDNDNDGRDAELDSNDNDPCIPISDNEACTNQQIDTDNDGKTDIAEGTGDTDGDGIPDFRESSVLDEDGDTVVDEADIANADPCVPSETSAACVDTTKDTDNDGKTDIEEGTGDSDGDEIPDFRESSLLDEDSDGVVDEEDIANADPCIPSDISAACVDTTQDTDNDGKSDAVEGNGDRDGDGVPDYLESAILDDDGDGTSNEGDRANLDPCIPSTQSEPCLEQETDTDGDGKTDLEEGTGDSDGDEIPDFRESSILDEDGDGVVDEADEENADPCIPSENNDACVDQDKDTDEDGESDLEEGTGDADGDGIPDYLESDQLDQDGDTVSDEADEENENPCVPNELNDACGILQRDSDDDGKTDLEEGIVDTDGDGLPDYLESAIKDLDGDDVVDELDPINGNPCVPSADSPACTSQTNEQ